MVKRKSSTKHLEPYRFQPGQSGNPAGRPKGSRVRLAEQFVDDLRVDWEAHGAKAIKAVREKKPHEYLKVIAGTLPKELNLKVDELDELTDDQIRLRLTRVAYRLAEAGISISAGAGEAEAPEPTGSVSTLQ